MAKRMACYDRTGAITAIITVDDADFARMSAHRWLLREGRRIQRVVTKTKAHPAYCVYFAREVMGLQRGDPRAVYHANGDVLDNRRSNLLVVKPGAPKRGAPETSEEGESAIRVARGRA